MLKNLKENIKSILRPLYFIGTRNENWLRIVMNQRTKEMVSALNPSSLNAAEISGDGWNKKETFKSFKSFNYPEFDICKSITDERFDIIFAEQVFEHLLWPYKAAKNVYDMLNDGGYFLITTPFLVKIHNYPVDCSRWTETGIKYFLAEAGFKLENIETGSWGNRWCLTANFKRFERYRKGFHSLKNEPQFPVTVWALAKK